MIARPTMSRALAGHAAALSDSRLRSFSISLDKNFESFLNVYFSKKTKFK